jgi:hypothetical protein
VSSEGVNHWQGGLVGHELGIACDWDTDDFKISNAFIYGEITTKDGLYKTIIANANFGDYSQYSVPYNFANIYYREGIGTILFDAPGPNGGDGLGTDTVKTVIKSKNAEEFASAGMAELLNNGRTGAAAPWEYIDGNDYPTLKASLTADSPAYSGAYYDSGGGGCDAGAAGMAAMAAAFVLTRKRRKD